MPLFLKLRKNKNHDINIPLQLTMQTRISYVCSTPEWS